MKQRDLDKPLLKLSAHSHWTIRDSLMHLLVLGTTGSGKSSSTIKYVMKSMLKAGFGLLCTTTKPTDAATYKAICKDTGRLGNVVEVTFQHTTFNVLHWQLLRTNYDMQAVVILVDYIIQIIRSTGPSPGKVGDEFWQASQTALLWATIPIVYAATRTLRVTDILAFIRSAPTSLEQMKDSAWQSQSTFFLFFCIVAELEPGDVPGFDDGMAERSMAHWKQMAATDARTVGNVVLTVTTNLSKLDGGLLGKMFCGDSNVTPELLFHNTVFILDMPLQVYGDTGAIAQKVWKFCVQEICLARTALDSSQSQVPVGLIIDEAHGFLFMDERFLALCRSSLVSCVFATQSIPAIRNMIGGDNPHDRAEHLISNFNSVVLHASSCPISNTWFSQKIGKSLQRRDNFSEGFGTNSNYGMSMNEGRNWGSNTSSGSSSSSGSGGTSSGSNSSSGTSSGGSDGRSRTRGTGSSENVSQGYSLQMDFTYDGGEFAKFRTGGPLNKGRVDAMFFMSGRRFVESGSNTLMVEYRQ